MAIYHLSIKPMSRKTGRSAVAAAAYRSGEKIHDLSADQVYDYTRRRGVEHTEIVLPTALAKLDVNWARDRQQLWNAAEAVEKRKDARVAREYEVALPHELNGEQRLKLVQAFSLEIANRYGVAVDFAIHKPHRSGDTRNHHAHIMTTTREVTATGLGAKTDIELGDRDRGKKGLAAGKVEIESIRERWGTLTNEHLLAQQLEIRIDHRSLEAQGIERTPQSHLGPAVNGLERRGVETQVGKRLEAEHAQALHEKREIAAERVEVQREEAALRVSLLELAAMAPQQRAKKPKVQEPAADSPLSQSIRELKEHLQALGPAKSAEHTRTVSAVRQPKDSAAVKPEQPEPRRTEAADRERERLAALNSRDLWELHRRINPPSVAQLVDHDPSVIGARELVETHRTAAAQALEGARRAVHESQRWRQAHGVQAKLHDLGVRPAEYLVERETREAESNRLREEALEAVTLARAQYTQVRSEAEQRLTQESAPARTKAAEIRQLAREAGERETLVKEFEQLADYRARGRTGYQDTSPEWQATPAKLRNMIDTYNRAPPEAQDEIRKRLSTTPVHAQSLEQVLKQRRGLDRDLDQDLSL